MTFLSPIPALIAASLAVPVLIVYYLLKLRRRPVRVSSTLLWMQAVRDVQVNVPFKWLRPTWLFFLQLAVLALLLLAMGRPAVDAGGGMPTKVILLIDRSASMSAVATADGRTRLDIAKQEALRTIDELWRGGQGGSTSAAVISMAAEPVAMTSFTTDRRRLRSAIESIAPSDQPAESRADGGQAARGLQAAFDLAGAMLAGDVEELGPREQGLVILYSDGVAAIRDGYTLSGEFRYLQIAEPNQETGSTPDNLGIVALSARRDWEDPATARIFTRIINAGGSTVTAPVALLVDGREVQRRALEVSATEGDDVGEAAATFSLDLRDGGIVTVRLLRDDVLNADNEASVVIDPARRARVLVVTPDGPRAEEGAPPARRTPDWLITELIREMRLPMRVVPITIYEQQLAASGGVPAADLVIFDRAQPQRMPPVPTITFGAGLPLEGVIVEPPPVDDPGTYVLSWQRTHPILRHVALDSLYVARSARIGVAATEDRRVQVRELARGSFGPLILEVTEGTTSHLLVGFELIQSNWPVQPGFMIFMASAVDHLTLRGESATGRAFSTAQPVTVLAPSGASRLTLEGPRRIAIDVPPQSGAGARRLNVGLIETAGVYRIEGVGGEEIDGRLPAIAVNLADATESALRSQGVIRVGGETHAARAGTAGPREVWHWFVLTALGLLCIEWFMNARRMRV